MKKTNYIKLREMESHKENPFAKQALVKIGQALTSRMVIGSNKDEAAILKAVEENTGKVLGNSVFMRNKTVDEEQFAKFFFAGFKAFFDLKPASIKVFGFILKQLRPNADYIMFFIDDCIKDTKLSAISVYRALGELCKADIIARGRTEEMYFINPMVVFNGDRVTFATTYIRSHFANQDDTSAANLKGTIHSLQSQGLLPPCEPHAQGSMAENLGVIGAEPLIPGDASPSPLPDVSDCPNPSKG